jgi:tRNA A37 threonylcarbamoyladenosine biosynthesis protein TsaE
MYFVIVYFIEWKARSQDSWKPQELKVLVDSQERKVRIGCKTYLKPFFIS